MIFNEDKWQKNLEELESEIASIITTLRATDPVSDEYKELGYRLKTLTEIKERYIEGMFKAENAYREGMKKDTDLEKLKLEREKLEFEKMKYEKQEEKDRQIEEQESNLSWIQRFWRDVDKTEIVKIVVVGSLVIITLKHEELNVITGKAAQLVLKMVHV